MGKDLVKLCIYYEISRSTRDKELEKKRISRSKPGNPKNGTLDFLERGCYKCEGYNNKCPYYTNERLLHYRK